MICIEETKSISIDGYIGVRSSVRTRITGVEAEREVHRLRTGFDAILIGNGTLRVDNPRLTVRMAPLGRSGIRRLVPDSQAKLPTEALIFEGIEESPLHIFTSRDAPEREVARLESRGAYVHSVRKF